MTPLKTNQGPSRRDAAREQNAKQASPSPEAVGIHRRKPKSRKVNSVDATALEMTEEEIQRIFIMAALRQRPHDENELEIVLKWLQTARVYGVIVDLVIDGALGLQVRRGEVIFRAIGKVCPPTRAR